MTTENWVLVADSVSARIYSLDSKHRHQPLNLIHELEHVDSKKKNHDLVSDRSGSFQAGSMTGRGSFVAHSEPKTVEIDKFARELAVLLEDGRLQNLYKEIIIVAAPHFYGALNKHVSKQVKDLVKKTVQKDYMHYTEPQLREAINGSLS
jgi:protein required for attachment to host cells